MTTQAKKDADKRYQSKPEIVKRNGVRGRMWERENAEKCRDRMRAIRAAFGRNDGQYAQMIDASMNPLVIREENVVLASDFHVPFTDEKMMDMLFAAADKHQTKALICAGDFFDCDNFSTFIKLTDSVSDYHMTWQKEQACAQDEIKRLLQYFDRLYFCRGNHEKRWINLNYGKMGMNQMFSLIRPRNLSDDEYEERVKVTSDDHMHLINNGQLWKVCHPKNFRITPLSVARDLSAKHLCNIFSGHGHSFNSGVDRSGKFRCLDGGGLFDADALEYLRDTTCHPAVCNGFFILKNGELHTVRGRGTSQLTSLDLPQLNSKPVVESNGE